mmetsp:Transcript_6544/g.11217  ORF Transcript_6544/g.11217 Transcript_6544/m.11217 type:complete len:102 (+) Transcript_6544:454-759(+)
MASLLLYRINALLVSTKTPSDAHVGFLMKNLNNLNNLNGGETGTKTSETSETCLLHKANVQMRGTNRNRFMCSQPCVKTNFWSFCSARKSALDMQFLDYEL